MLDKMRQEVMSPAAAHKQKVFQDVNGCVWFPFIS